MSEMNINETIAEVLRLDAEPEESTWNLIEKHAYYRTAAPYYRTAAPALAREVQRLQAEVQRLRAEIKRSRPSGVVCGTGVHVDIFCGDACYTAYYDLTE